MIRRTITSFSLPIFAVLFFCCNRGGSPEASFNLERTDYTTGETITLINTSTDAESYAWSFPNGTSSSEKNPHYLISPSSRAATETIGLVAYGKKNKKQSLATQTYTLFIKSESDEFFQLDSVEHKPAKKFIEDIGGFTSYRFLGEGNDPAFQGRILFRGPLPPPGSYLVDNLNITVEATDAGYSGKMRYTSNVEWGGTIHLSKSSNERVRMILTDVRLHEPLTKKEVLFSGELTF